MSGLLNTLLRTTSSLNSRFKQLIDAGWLTFQEDKPNVEKNPLSSHVGPSTNAIMKDVGQSLVRRVEDIKSPLKDIFALICQMGYFKFGGKLEGTCGFHASKEHSIDKCFEFRSFLQDLLDKHILQVCHPGKKAEVCTHTSEEPKLSGPRPLVLHFARNPIMLGERRPVVIQTP